MSRSQVSPAPPSAARRPRAGPTLERGVDRPAGDECDGDRDQAVPAGEQPGRDHDDGRRRAARLAPAECGSGFFSATRRRATARSGRASRQSSTPAAPTPSGDPEGALGAVVEGDLPGVAAGDAASPASSRRPAAAASSVAVQVACQPGLMFCGRTRIVWTRAPGRSDRCSRASRRSHGRTVERCRRRRRCGDPRSA